MSKSQRRASKTDASSRPPVLLNAAVALAALALFVGPLVYFENLREPYRLPKLVVTEGLALLSVLVLVVHQLLARSKVSSRLWRHPTLLVALPYLFAACLSLLATTHAAHSREALYSLFVASLTLVGWSFLRERLWLLLCVIACSGVVAAVIAILQFLGTLEIGETDVRNERLHLTSVIGGVGDLAAFLVLPLVVGQVALSRLLGDRRRRTLAAVVLAGLVVLAVTLVMTQTIAAIAAAITATACVWLVLLPRRTFFFGAGASLLLVIAGLFVVAPVRDRVVDKVEAYSRGNLNDALTGRLDGWYAGIDMFQQSPLLGVGHGAYVANYTETKLRLLEAGVDFYPQHGRASTFANAHSELVEVAAETGVVGLLAVGAAVLVLVRCLLRLRRREPWEIALGLGGASALLVLSFASFPFRLAATGYGAVAFFAWLAFAAEREEGEEA